jgi:hypothetical protein
MSKSKFVDPSDLNTDDLRAEANVPGDHGHYEVHVYPIYRAVVKVPVSIAADTATAAAHAENLVMEACQAGTNHYVGGLELVFAEGLDTSLVDRVKPDGNVIGSFCHGVKHDVAMEHAKVLEELIDGKQDELGEILRPIAIFLRTSHK